MRLPVFAAILLSVAGVFLLTKTCREKPPQPDNSAQAPTQTPSAPTADQETIEKAIAVLAPLIDPAKLDTLTGKRAATPRLRKACYWIEVARRGGETPAAVIESAQRLTGFSCLDALQWTSAILSRYSGKFEITTL